MSAPSMGMGYPASVMRRAVELKRAGWSAPRVADFLEEEMGVRPSRWAISRWADEQLAERKREDDRARNQSLRAARSDGRLGDNRHSPTFQAARIRALAGTGMTKENIRRVMRLDYPKARWSMYRIEQILDGRRAA
jgi:hypothetical protein